MQRNQPAVGHDEFFQQFYAQTSRTIIQYRKEENREPVNRSLFKAIQLLHGKFHPCGVQYVASESPDGQKNP